MASLWVEVEMKPYSTAGYFRREDRKTVVANHGTPDQRARPRRRAQMRRQVRALRRAVRRDLRQLVK